MGPIPEETDTASEVSQEEGGQPMENMGSPMVSNLIRYTSTPHLQHLGGGEVSPKDISPSDERRVKPDSGFEDSSLVFPTASLSEAKNATRDVIVNTSTEMTTVPSPVMLSISPPEMATISSPVMSSEKIVNREEARCLVEENLEAFLTFTGFPAEHMSTIIDKFMSSGLTTLTDGSVVSTGGSVVSTGGSVV